MNRRIGVGLTLTAMAFVLALGTAAPSQDTVAVSSFAKFLPKDCMLYVSVRDVSGLRAHLEAAGLKELWDSPEMKEFLAYLAKKAEEGGAGAERPKALQDVKPEDLLNAVEGEVCFAVGKLDIAKIAEAAQNNEQPPIPDEIYFLVNAKGKADAFADLLKKGTQAATDAGAKKSEEDYKGVKIATYSAPNDEGGFSVCRSGSWFALGTTAEGLKRLVKRSQESAGDDLASNPTFTSVTRAVGENADLTVYANLEDVIKGVKKAVKDAAENAGGPGAAAVDPVIDGLGIESVKAAGFGVTVGADRVTSKAYVHTPGGAKGIISGIFPTGSNPSVPAYVPEDASSFTASRTDLAKIYNEVMDMAAEIAKASDFPVDPEQALEASGIQLKDLVGQLKGESYGVGKYNKPFTAKSAENVSIWALKDGKAFLDNLLDTTDSIIQKAPMMGLEIELQEEEYLGTKVYTLDQLATSFAVKDNAFITGGKDNVKAAMRRMGGGEKTLADNALYQELSKELPASYQSVSFSNPDGFEWFLTIAKSGDIFSLMGGGGMPGGLPGGMDPEELKQQLMENFDFTKIPSPALFVKRLVGSIGYTTTTGDGTTIVSILKLKKTG